MATQVLTTMQARAEGLISRKRMIAFTVPGVLLAYFVYIFFAFDIAGLVQRAQPANALTLAADTVSHKVHVPRGMEPSRRVSTARVSKRTSAMRRQTG